MNRSIALVSCLGLCVVFCPRDGQAQLATRTTAATLLPEGNYECKMGSYAFRACKVVAEKGGVVLEIPAGIGHFLAMRAEILPSDDKGQLTVLGRFADKSNLCGSCTDEETGKGGSCPEPLVDKKACLDQPLVARLRMKKERTFQGTLYYFINRPSYDKAPEGLRYHSSFKLGNTIDLQIRPAPAGK